MDYQALVREFHIRFGHPVNDVPTLVPEANALRIALIREELDELKAGIAKGCRVEIADACADLLYVIYGAAVVYGVRLDTWSISGDTTSTLDWLERGLSGLSAAFNAPMQSVTQPFTPALTLMAEDVLTIAANYDIPIESCFEEVHRSNLSKAWKAEECIPIMDKLENGELFVRELQDATDGRKYVVTNAAAKVVKSPSYSPADIAGILARQEVAA
jgi:predicted HAD superfamily Cof-like phosphohydrolase